MKTLNSITIIVILFQITSCGMFQSEEQTNDNDSINLSSSISSSIETSNTSSVIQTQIDSNSKTEDILGISDPIFNDLVARSPQVSCEYNLLDVMESPTIDMVWIDEINILGAIRRTDYSVSNQVLRVRTDAGFNFPDNERYNCRMGKVSIRNPGQEFKMVEDLLNYACQLDTMKTVVYGCRDGQNPDIPEWMDGYDCNNLLEVESDYVSPVLAINAGDNVFSFQTLPQELSLYNLDLGQTTLAISATQWVSEEIYDPEWGEECNQSVHEEN